METPINEDPDIAQFLGQSIIQYFKEFTEEVEHSNKKTGIPYKKKIFYGKSVGVAIAVVSNVEGSEVNIGFSKTSSKKPRPGEAKDVFNKQFGQEIAYERAMKGSKVNVPYEVKEQYLSFINRCKKYFKQAHRFNVAGNL